MLRPSEQPSRVYLYNLLSLFAMRTYIPTEPEAEAHGFGAKPRGGFCRDGLPWNHFGQYRYPASPPASEDDGHLELDLRPAPTRLVNEPVVAVLGVGYVGSHLVESFSRQFSVIGYDVSPLRVRELRAKYSGKASMIEITNDPKEISRATHFLISVPTLLCADRTIDSSYLEDALEIVRMFAQRGSTVVIESSVSVGMTRQLLGPLAKSCGLYAGMSPEVSNCTSRNIPRLIMLQRVDPGRLDPPMQSIPKVISALDDVVPGSLASITRVYQAAFDQLVPVSKLELQR